MQNRLEKFILMDVNSLQLFACIVEGGNLSAAARALNMTRSNVSRRLRALEEAVGTPLLRRTTHDASLTPAGEMLYARARNIARELAAAQAEFGSKGAGLRGRVKVLVPRSLVQFALSGVLTRFSLDHPDVALDVVHSNEVTDLHAERIDVAVHIARRPIETAVVTWRSEIEWVMCASPGYLQKAGAPRTLAELAGHSVICYAVRDGIIPLVASKGGQCERVTLHARLRTNDLQFTREAACAGAGIGILARYAVDRTLEEERLIELLPEYSFSFNSTKLYVQTMEARYQTPLARVLTQRIRDCLQSLELVRTKVAVQTAA